MQPFKLFLHDPFPKLFLSNFISKSQDDAGAGCGVLAAGWRGDAVVFIRQTR